MRTHRPLWVEWDSSYLPGIQVSLKTSAPSSPKQNALGESFSELSIGHNIKEVSPTKKIKFLTAEGLVRSPYNHTPPYTHYSYKDKNNLMGIGTDIDKHKTASYKKNAAPH